jgi:hypothetical protein
MDSDPDRTVREIAGMICCLVMAIFVLGCLTYGCTRPVVPRAVDQELQAQRVIENNKMAGCIRAGGSWMPVRVPGYQPEMSCVTATTLSLATKMNIKEVE